jgi:spore maturation protein CgeB
MREFGFISNRIFDALACGTFVVSDDISAAKELFNDNIATYNSVDDLDSKLEYYLTNDDERELKAKNGKEIVVKNHTFEEKNFLLWLKK